MLRDRGQEGFAVGCALGATERSRGNLLVLRVDLHHRAHSGQPTGREVLRQVSQALQDPRFEHKLVE